MNVGRTEPVVLSRQVITLPANAGAPLFADVDGDGRSDLLVMVPAHKTILNHHQRPDGFTNPPDQVIPLPPQTAWAALCDVEAHPGLELLFSTATGLVYSRQDGGRFESERHLLIEENQKFTSFGLPTLTLLSTNKAGTNDLIPVMTAGQSVLYHRNSAYEWIPGPPVTLDVQQTVWDVNKDAWHVPWALGANPAHSLRVQQSFRAKPDLERGREPENETIRKIMDDMKKNAAVGQPGITRVDVDGDGLEDLVLWQGNFRLDFKTDLYMFLRGADQKLPERPTQSLHCGGFPIPVGSTYEASPVCDLNGDGICELVLLEPTTVLTSKSGVVETALSHGVECSLKIRSLHRRAFARNLDASVLVTFLLSLGELGTWPFCIQGDFNGDGRPDFLIRRSDTRWNIFFSTTDKRWFADQPAMTFDAPAGGFAKIGDLNGDRLADIVWHELDNPNLSIFMSPPRMAKAKKP